MDLDLNRIPIRLSYKLNYLTLTRIILDKNEDRAALEELNSNIIIYNKYYTSWNENEFLTQNKRILKYVETRKTKSNGLFIGLMQFDHGNNIVIYTENNYLKFKIAKCENLINKL